MQIRFTSDIATASLPVANAPSGKRKRSRDNVSRQMECKILDACGNFVVRAIGRRKSPGSKGFPISLNGALIVILRTRGWRAKWPLS